MITDELIDPFGLEHEFRDKGPLKPHPPDDSDATSESAVKRPPKWDINPALPREVRKRFKKMLQKQQKVFAGIERRLGKIDKKFDMKIDADISQLRSAQPYRTSPAKRKLIQSAIKELLDKDVIQPSSSPFASPVVVVIQKGKPRFCIDLREVNNKTIADRYALPKQDSIFHALRGSIIFTIIDANKGYHQFGLTFDSRKLTAFITEDGFYEFKRIPFGLKNAPAHFQRAMDTILANYRWDFALAYIDDIIIFSKSADEHILHVQLVLEALIKVGMTVDENKCHFGYEEIELLGHRVNRLGLSTQPQKVKAITDLPFPRTIKHGHQVVGQFNYYREFIKNYAEIAEPLTTALSFKSTTAAEKPKSSERDLKKEYRLRSTNPFPDNTATRTAFERLKTAISSAPVLIHPNFDKPFSLYVDASRIGIGCALHQVSDVDNKEHPVLFVSRVLRPAEKNYSATELECLGVVWSLHKLKYYVDGAQIKIFTDHSALKWIWNLKSTVNSRLFRWSLILNPLQHKVTIVHRPGRLHNNVDPLSRNPSNSVYTNVNLYYARDEYVDKLWSGYLSDRYFRTILQQLIRHNLPKGGSPSLNPSLASLASLTSPSRPPPSNLGPPADASLAVTELRRQPTQRSIQNGTTPTNVATPTYVTTRSAKISPTHPKESAHDETSESPPPAKSQTVDEDEVVQESGQTKESTEHEVSKDKDDANILLEYVDTLKDNGKEKESTITDGTFTLIGKALFFSERRQGSLRLCIPESLINDFLHLCHDLSSHPGHRRTYLSCSLRFYFPRMSRRIKSYCENCRSCQLSKPSNQKTPGLLHSIETLDPFHTLSLDFVTGLPHSEDGYNALLTVTDKFSKAIKLIPCHETTSAEDTAQLYLRYAYSTFGLPVKLISDRDSRFTSKFWRTLMALLGVDIGMTSAFHPQADGQAEKTNATVEIALRCFLAGDTAKYAKWTSYLPIIEHEYNSTIHSSTGFSPNQLRYAVSPRSIADLSYPIEGASESAEQLTEDLKCRRDEARDSIAIAQRKQRRLYNKTRSPKEFNVGDSVILKYHRFGPGYKPPREHRHKLGLLGVPLRIIEKISPLSYRLQLPPNSRIHDVVSIIHLKPCRGDVSDGDDAPPPPPVEVDGIPEYEVERIDGERRRSNNQKEYLVKWKGYSDAERTWEPLSNLNNASELVADWHANQSERPPTNDATNDAKPKARKARYQPPRTAAR